ncbi:hypothetical protein ACFGVS_19160 [Mucilaginibacter sp. AW1-7]|uniref:TRADD-N-associated membrane domain-containing protein n=1 Tax=Mucilaginibacter sp. AW1-7 TaxID=3349874 RepID=UPI003F73B463
MAQPLNAPSIQQSTKPVRSVLQYMRMAYRIQMLTIILGIVFYLLASYFRVNYIFEKSRSIDLILSTNKVLARHLNKKLTPQYIDSVRTDMTHEMAHGGYMAIPIDRFMTTDSVIRMDNDKQVIESLSKLSDTAGYNPNELTDRVQNTVSKSFFNKYGLSQFITGGNWWSPWATPIAVFLGVDIFLLLITGYRISLERDKAERARAQLNASNNPKDIRLSWVSAQTTLDTYYRRNLEQNTWTFILSVIVMVIGFILIFWGIGKAISGDSTDKNTSLVSILSTSAGIITQLIGGTFLAIYNSTLKQALDYTTNLQKTSTVGTSLAILNSIEIDDEDVMLADPTIAGKLVDAKIEIAKQLIEQSK